MDSEGVVALGGELGDEERAEIFGPFVQEEFLVQMSSDPLPYFSDLKRQFPGLDNVSGIFDGRPFVQHPARAGLERRHGERIFLVRCYGREIEYEEAIKEMYGFGWRPANEKGAYRLVMSHPDYFRDDVEPHRPNWILAPGSHAVAAGNELIAAVSFGAEWRSLGSRMRANPASPRMGILFEKA